MDRQFIISELKKERDRINQAIAALDGTAARTAVSPSKKPPYAGTHVSRKRHWTAAGRKRLSKLMKQRWAERRRKASTRRSSAAKAA
jgi:hypothetical protein